MNPRAKFGGGKINKVKKYSGTERSDVEADSVEDKRAARNARIAEYNATPKAQEAKRRAESEVRKLNIPGPDTDYETKSSSAVSAIKAGAAKADKTPKKPSKPTSSAIKDAAKSGLRYDPKTEEVARRAVAENRKAKNIPAPDVSKPYPYDLPESTISAMPGGKEMQEREAARLERESEDRGAKAQEEEKTQREYDEGYERYKRWKETEGMKKGGKVGKKNWIAGAIKKPGALRQSLGVKKGEKIPAKKLASAAKKPGKMGQRARLAQTLKKFCKGGGIEAKGKTRGRMV